jgi:hypothetical protein
MGKLTEYLKAEADTIRAGRERRRAAVAEWLGILNNLFVRIDGWLDASDPDRLLDRTAPSADLWDPALGHYTAPTRRITVGDKVVEVVPKARYIAWPIRPPGSDKVARANGLVELRDPIGSVVYLFQLPGDRWFIKADAANINVSENAVEPLDRERFEAALAGLLA